MINREAEVLLEELLLGFPIVSIIGPRQSGKTTLAKKVFADKPYFSLEDPDLRQIIQEDPRAFLERIRDGAVLDEVQRFPELFSYLQSNVDADHRMGRFLLTSSQQFGMLSRINQSLAGRTAFVELLPLTIAELSLAQVAPQELDTLLLSGGYPPLYSRRVRPARWFPAYFAAYVERDVRQLSKVQDLSQFQKFIRLCAGRSGQLVNLSSLANEGGITHNTAKSWLSILEASYILFQLPPYHGNFNKRLIKTPKLYFYDVGLLSWLLGIRTRDQLTVHPLRGQIFETMVIAELVKSYFNQGEKPPLYFWRDSNGNEVDIIAVAGNCLRPLEIKAGQTLNRDFFSSLNHWLKLAGKRAVSPALIYAGEQEFQRAGVDILNWRHIPKWFQIV